MVIPYGHGIWQASSQAVNLDRMSWACGSRSRLLERGVIALQSRTKYALACALVSCHLDQNIRGPAADLPTKDTPAGRLETRLSALHLSLHAEYQVRPLT